MKETALERWDRGKTLLLESLYKPDSKLRGCAYNQNCFDEMISLRDSVIEYVKSIPNPCLLYTSPSPRDRTRSRMPSSA